MYGFYRTASVDIEDVIHRRQNVGTFLRSASNNNTLGRNILNPLVFQAVSDAYHVSPDPLDFVYVVARAVGADAPNNNGDAFPNEELLRFTVPWNRLVFSTFENDPLHVDHKAEDPTTAKGFLPDAEYYAASGDDDIHIKTVVAACRKKDPLFAQGIQSGDLDSFSMGAEVRFTVCSICGNVAHNEYQFCEHIPAQKMQLVNGELCFEKCFGVRFAELSGVHDPAYEKALTEAKLGAWEPDPYALAAIHKEASAIQGKSLTIEGLGLDNAEMETVHRYFHAHWDRMPLSMQHLGQNLFQEAIR